MATLPRSCSINGQPLFGWSFAKSEYGWKAFGERSPWSPANARLGGREVKLEVLACIAHHPCAEKASNTHSISEPSKYTCTDGRQPARNPNQGHVIPVKGM